MRLRQMDAQAELRWMMRKEVTLRSVQGEALQAVQEGQSPIVVVMPTGRARACCSCCRRSYRWEA